MKIEPTSLDGVLRITPKRFGDARGFLAESWKRSAFAEAGLPTDFAQDNHSLSEATGTLRGLHFQVPPHGQGKLVRCGRGALYDVAVDLRRDSPSYGKWVGETLSFENGVQLWIPEGFAHGFVTLEPMTEIVYKCTREYAPEADGGIRWDSCGVDWPIAVPPILSEKDMHAPALSDFDSPFRCAP